MNNEYAGRNDNIHGDEVGFGFIETVVNPVYCDYFASLIQCLDEVDSESLIKSIGKIENDLHPKYGYLISTKKVISLTDTNDKSYTITIEET